MKNTLLSLLAIAALLFPATSRAVTIELSGTHHSSVSASSQAHWQFDNSSSFNFSGDSSFRTDWLGNLQSWLNSPQTQQLLTNVSTHVQDPDLSNLVTHLISDNFQIDSTARSDFQSWLQNHHFQLDSNCATNFCSWVQNHQDCDNDRDHHHGDNDHSWCDHGGDHTPTPVPEPSSLLCLLSGALSLGVYAARKK
jgi:hypothetical protein